MNLDANSKTSFPIILLFYQILIKNFCVFVFYLLKGEE